MALGLVSTLALGAGATAQAAQAASSDVLGSRWSETTLPVDDSRGAAIVRPDAHTTWIAGTRMVQAGKVMTFAPSLIERDTRKGDGWSEVGLPALPAGADVQIYGADASTSRSGFLVGDNHEAVGGFLTERRDGSSWRVVPAAAPADIMVGSLLAVDEITPNNAWAVGFAQIFDGFIPDPDGGLPQQVDHTEPIVRHWDGAAWQVVDLSAIVPDSYLFSVTAISARDVWAVGRTADLKPIAVHFDGTSWTNVPVPDANGELRDVIARGPNDVWAVGGKRNVSDTGAEAFALRFDGTGWREVPMPTGTGVLDRGVLTGGGLLCVGSDESATNPFALTIASGQVRPVPLPAGTSDLNITALDVHGSELLLAGFRAHGEGPDYGWTPTLLTHRR
ncbi:hypothetical protein [Streptomyces sp. SID3343]|uniref:hypothetical protein n=1 Tax=Streptomyces sp. SID3343 TaxID=2690260 RepID=UPI0013710A81|nr:hypothetical protein [Streptomyces sp. SID3343]MYV98752.1 hypothetical protein [Streptomyces sp. SID3343]